MEYPTTVTANTSFTFYKWGGDTIIITPVYVYGTPTAVSTVTSTADDYAVHTLPNSDRIYWSSTTDTESTYGTTYTTAYLDMYEFPLTDLYPVPTPVCTITEVYSETCDDGGAGQYCNIYGGTVEVFYWPGVTPGPDGKFANTTKPVDPSTTEVSGITMTSPSVYVSFQSVYAADSCRQIGAMHTGSVLAFDPASISTVYGGPGFMSDNVPDGASVYNFGDLGPTINAAAYERQVDCVVDTGCPTIYPTYAPTISVPSELLSLDASWASCYPDFRGFYDPPKALQQAQTVDGVSGYTSATPSPTISPVAANTGGATTSKAQSTGEATSSVAVPSDYDQGTSTGRVSSPVAKTSETTLQQSGYTRPMSDPSSDAGSGPSQTTTVASSTAESASPQPANSQATSADPGGVVGSLLGGQGSSTPEAVQSSQADSGPDSAQATDAGGIVGSLLGGGSTQGGGDAAASDPSHTAAAVGSDPEQTTAAVDSDPAITTADPGGPGSQAAAASDVAITSVNPGGLEDPAGSPALTVAGSTITPDASGNYIIGSSTLVAGSSAVVVSGTTYSLAASGSAVVVNGITQPLAAAASVTSSPGVYVVNGQTYTQGASSGVVVAGITLIPGSQTVVSGTTYSLASSGSALVASGVTGSAQAAAQATGAEGVFTANGQTYTEGSSSEVVIAGQTLSPGSQTVISGTTYSLASSGSSLVVNGVTQTLQAAQTSDAILTVGSNTYTEDQSVSGFVIGSDTLTGGGTIVVGSGTAAQTLRMTTGPNGETEVVFGTTSTEVLSGASEASSSVHLPSSTTAASESRANAATAASGTITTPSAATSRPELRAARLVLTALWICCLLVV
ncbi:hypothetical protein LTR85_001139 [Meristemomyces frigidus]|nr:hypothetical protein LTR85_001139 [Meristemomyces frigidus]